MGRIIKRYGNRKLYDTRESRYITLDEVAGFVREGEEVTVVENATGTDLTCVAFAQILLEEERRKGGFLSLPLLRQLIRQGGPTGEAIASEVHGGVNGLGRFDILGGAEGFGMGGHKPVD